VGQDHFNVLELGAGAGVASMVCALLKPASKTVSVYSTEQQSCLPYLRRNLQLNADIIGVHPRELHWEQGVPADGPQTYDLVMGCDVTYDPKSFPALLQCLGCAIGLHGTALVAHDNDSCPMSKFAFAQLGAACKSYDLEMEEVDYRNCVGPRFFSDKVKLWEFKRKQPVT
jgi:predicted nicotinamide N-methyase